MTAWMLIFVVVSIINGQTVEREHRVLVPTAEACITALRAEQAVLPRTSQIVRPDCREVWRT